MKNKIYISAFLFSTFFSMHSIRAQDPPELDRRVDVSRDYTPDVERSPKLLVEPDLSDTVRLRPDFAYSIRPTAWMNVFGVQAINPVRVSAVEYTRNYPFYIKAGGGYPGQTLIDAYATTPTGRNGYLGGYINHLGLFPKIKSDVGDKEKAVSTRNSIGLFGRTAVGRRMILSGDLVYDYNLYSAYGRYRIENAPLASYGGNSDILSFSTPRLGFSFGNDFTDLSLFNFRVGIDASHTSGRSDVKEGNVGVDLGFGQMFGVHKFVVNAGMDGYFGGGKVSDYDNKIFRTGLVYEVEMNNFGLRIGGLFAHDNNSYYGSKNWFLPDFRIMFNPAHGHFIPYASLESRIVNNGYRNITLRNPYLLFDTDLLPAGNHLLPKNSVEYDLRGGISGSVSSVFSYRAYGGATLIRDPLFFVNLYEEGNTSRFGWTTDRRMTVITAGAEFDGRFSGFEWSVTGRYRGYTLKNFDKAGGLPNIDGKIIFGYNHHDRWMVRAGVEYIGRRYFYEMSTPLNAGAAQGDYDGYIYTFDLHKAKAAINLTLEGEYRPAERFAIFLIAENLTGSKLYRYNHYRDRGVGITAGVKLSF